MNFAQTAPPLPHALDRGTLVVIAALFLVSILAHRLWRGKIRAEDEREALRRDLAFSQDRYRAAFRALNVPAAFADRATGLVMEATGGWAGAGLPEAGKAIWSQAPELEAAWRAIPAPGPEGQPAAPFDLPAGPVLLKATPLAGASLGVIFLEGR